LKHLAFKAEEKSVTVVVFGDAASLSPTQQVKMNNALFTLRYLTKEKRLRLHLE